MKKIFLTLLLLSAAILYYGCDIHDFDEFDDEPPSPPTNIYTVTGDNRVDIMWDENPERDVAGYNVYFSWDDYKYELLGSTENNYYIDYGAENGETYYYAVTAYDYNGNESDLSEDLAYDTPRPEGFNQTIFNYLEFPNNSGYDFSNYSVIAYDSLDTDFFFENYDGTFYLDVWRDSDIQDMGQTKDIYDISYAPTSGWSNTKDAIAIVGHTYVIWTWDNHYAKIRIKNITSERVVFDWAYQTVEGNDELKANRRPDKREPLNKEEFKTRVGKRS